MAEQLRVFVSHSHQDNAFCHAIVKALRDAGANVWYDEHDMGWGPLKDVIISELGKRPIFVLILSKAVFSSRWVKRETDWADELADRDPTRVILPVTAGPIARDDFGTDNGWLFLYGYKRIEAPGFRPYPMNEAATRLLRALGLPLATATSTALDQQPTEDVNDLLTKGKALIAQEQYAEALPLFERASRLAPNLSDAWGYLGWVLLELGRYQEAVAASDQALALNPNDPLTWRNRKFAKLYLARNAEAEAEEATVHINELYGEGAASGSRTASGQI